MLSCDEGFLSSSCTCPLGKTQALGKNEDFWDRRINNILRSGRIKMTVEAGFGGTIMVVFA